MCSRETKQPRRMAPGAIEGREALRLSPNRVTAATEAEASAVAASGGEGA